MSGHIRGKRKPPSQRFPKGAWEAAWPDGRKPNGNVQWKAKSFATKVEAQRFLNNLNVARDSGTYIDPTRAKTSFAEVADDWYRTASRTLRPKTLLGYRSTLNNHVLPYWGGYKVGAIDYEGINKWIDVLLVKNSPSVTRGAYKILRLVLKHAVLLRKIAFNPTTGIKLPKVPHSEMLFLNHSEVDRLADALTFRPRTSKHDPGRPDRPELGLLVRFAAYTGLRAGEIAALRIKHLNLGTDPSVRVEQSVSDVNGHLTFDTPKTKAGERTVPLPEFLVPQLAAMIAHRRLDPNAFVFVSEQGGIFRHANFMKRFWHEATARAGLPPTLRFHDLRHTCASFLVESKTHPKEMSQLLGHSSIVITMDRYSHVFPELTSAVARNLDSARTRALGTDETLAPVVPLH